MRYLMSTILSLFLAAPAIANPSMCSMTGPHNCQQESEVQLVDITKSTIHNMELRRERAFKTENDTALEKYGRSQVVLNIPDQSARYLFLHR